jgi:hypothetical protein
MTNLILAFLGLMAFPMFCVICFGLMLKYVNKKSKIYKHFISLEEIP